MTKNRNSKTSGSRSRKMTKEEAGRMGGKAHHTCRGRECSTSSSKHSGKSRSR